jgi:hypothetical protein
LKACDNLLTRVLLATLLAVKETTPCHSEMYNQISRRIERLTVLVMRLHGDPFRFFFCCFEKELRAIRNLSVLLHARSMCVRVAQLIWTAYPSAVSDLVMPLVSFSNRLDSRKLIALTTNIGGEEREQRMSQLMKCLQELLCVEKIPPGICILCYRCTLAVEAVEMEGLYQSKRHWAVATLIFQHYIIPTYNTLVWTSIVTDIERKRIILIERLLRKLAFRRFFEYGPCVVNDVLVDCCSLFDSFCEKVLAIGQSLERHSELSIQLGIKFSKMPKVDSQFFAFLLKYEESIVVTLREMIHLESGGREGLHPSQARELLVIFKRALTDVLSSPSM